MARVAAQMESYVPFSRTQGYEAIHDDATSFNGKQGLPRFSDVTQIEAQPGARVAFGISNSHLSALNEVRQSRTHGQARQYRHCSSGLLVQNKDKAGLKQLGGLSA